VLFGMIDHNGLNTTAQGRATLKAIRLELNQTQESMARLLGLNTRSYQKWEGGERGVNLSMEQVVLLDRHLAILGKRFSDYWPPAEHESPN
jgi:transcriptional regulator with XRE-family HTH domain